MICLCMSSLWLSLLCRNEYGQSVPTALSNVASGWILGKIRYGIRCRICNPGVLLLIYQSLWPRPVCPLNKYSAGMRVAGSMRVLGSGDKGETRKARRRDKKGATRKARQGLEGAIRV